MQQTQMLHHTLGWQSNVRRIFIVTTLAFLIGTVAACGRSRAPEGLPTEVPTLAAAQPATATPIPAATPAPVAATKPSASSAITATTTVSTSTGTTATGSVTATTTASNTSAMTTTAPVTTTPSVTATTAVTTATAVTTTAPVTTGATTTTTTPVTNTSLMTGTGTMTGMGTMTATKTTTNTAAAPRVFFRQPTNGATIPLTTTIVMSATGLTVEPAGAIHEGAGHFHILVDKDFIAAGNAIPKDAADLHFGKGQLTTTITLTPGIHVLRLQFANGAHIALDGAQYRDTLTVTVKAGAPAQSVHFVTPQNGATVTGTFDVVMAAAGLIVEPSGAIQANAGHFHILVDKDFVAAGNAIPKDAQDLHYGKGQLKTELTLPPGQHILRLQLANGAHIALDGLQYRDEITVTVK